MTTDPVEMAEEILYRAEALNTRLRHAAELKLSDARRIVDTVREAEGWLVGIRELLETE